MNAEIFFQLSARAFIVKKLFLDIIRIYNGVERF